MKSKNILAINLKYYRYLAKLSQEKFAEALNTSLIYLNQLENGRRNPSLEMLDKISINLSHLLNTNVTLADLITYDPRKKINSKRIDEKKESSF